MTDYRYRTHTSGLALLILACGQTFAQTPPNAGQLLQQMTPPLSAPSRGTSAPSQEESRAPVIPAGQRILIKSFRIQGASVFSDAELLALIGDATGRELSLAELDAVAARITRHYRDAGYLVASAYLPPQDVQNGVVTIAVSEGRIGEVRVDNRAGLAASALAPLEGLTAGSLVNGEVLSGSLLRLSDLPGVEVKSTLRPGAAVGTSDFLVDVAPGAALSGSVDMDSFGNRYTGTYRLGTSLAWNNPAQLGDQATLRLQTSEDGFTYGRLGYQLPFGPAATRIGASWSDMRYRLGKGFTSLKADGEATVGSVYLQHPFIRSRQANLYGQVQYDDKHLQDRVAATSTATDKRLGNWTVSLNGTLEDGLGGGGSNGGNLAYTAGHLQLDRLSAGIDAGTAKSRGSFGKWNAGYQRSQRLPEDFVLGFSYSGQWSDKNLDSSEKFFLGGAYGVRAYPQGEASGDEGHLMSLELRHPLDPNWELLGFYDDGRVTLNRKPWTGSANTRHLAGYGLGATYAGGGFALRMFAAWKASTGAPTSDQDRNPRLWVQGAFYF